MNDIRAFVGNHQGKPNASDKCTFVNTLSARDRRFVQELADALRLHATWEEVDEYGQPLVVLSFDMEGLSEAEETDEDGDQDEEEGDWQSEDEEGEGDAAVQRVFRKYDRAKIVENTEEDFEEAYEEKIKENLVDWKRRYYKASYALTVRLPADYGTSSIGEA